MPCAKDRPLREANGTSRSAAISCWELAFRKLQVPYDSRKIITKRRIGQVDNAERRAEWARPFAIFHRR
jgi:hypothetical protein